MFREEATSALAGFHAGPLCWSHCFVKGGKPENPGENVLSKAWTNNKLNTHIAPGRKIISKNIQNYLQLSIGIWDPSVLWYWLIVTVNLAFFFRSNWLFCVFSPSRLDQSIPACFFKQYNQFAKSRRIMCHQQWKLNQQYLCLRIRVEQQALPVYFLCSSTAYGCRHYTAVFTCACVHRWECSP